MLKTQHYMKRLSGKYLFAAITLTFLSYASAGEEDLKVAAVQPTQAVYRAVLADESELWIAGESTLGHFSSYASIINVDSEIRVNRNSPAPSGTNVVTVESDMFKIPQFVVTVPIKDMKSKFIGLASYLHRALKYEQFPNIIFDMKGYALTESTAAKETEEETSRVFKITADGLLSLGGVTNAAQLIMDADMKDDVLHVTGSHDVLMTDFGITPPSLFFGKIVVADKISVNWNLNASATETAHKEE